MLFFDGYADDGDADDLSVDRARDVRYSGEKTSTSTAYMVYRFSPTVLVNADANRKGHPPYTQTSDIQITYIFAK